MSNGSVLHTMMLLVLYWHRWQGRRHPLAQTTLSTKGSPAKGVERPDGPVHNKSIMALVGRVYESPELVMMVMMVQRCDRRGQLRL